MEGTIFDIQHFAVHDGPGIRTLVFMKGCPLSCAWCCNPESRSPRPQLRYIEHNCTACYGCMAVCPAGAIYPGGEKIAIDFTACETCETKPCLDACYHGALLLTGKAIDTAKLIGIISKDIPFYRNSGGGVTFTGGEPLAQADFLLEMLKECRKNGIHTAIETCGCGDPADFGRIAPFTDLFLFDIKIVDSGLHREYTGRDNRLILENLERLAALNASITLRFPLIPGITDTNENILDVMLLMDRLGLQQIDLEPGHSLGFAKYDELGMTNPMSGKLDDTGYSPNRLDSVCTRMERIQKERGFTQIRINRSV